MQDGGSNSAALRAANAPSASLLSADGEDRVRLPGPAITVEPSAEAVAAVQALFARQPQLMADAGAAVEFDVFSPAGASLLRAASELQQSDSRMRTGGAAPKRARREGSGAGGEALVLAAAPPPPSAASEPAPAAALCADAAHPSTPQQAIPRRTSAPY